MANLEHLGILRQGADKWNEWWHSQLPMIDVSAPDFHSQLANLPKADLSKANLSREYLSEVDLGDANLSGANLREANLSRANLSGSDLREANLAVANLQSHMHKCQAHRSQFGRDQPRGGRPDRRMGLRNLRVGPPTQRRNPARSPHHAF